MGKFTDEDDKHLVQYIAVNNPGMKNRLGNKLYERLAENKDHEWPWAEHHPASSWRERYKRDREYFDCHIKRFQRKRAIKRSPSPVKTPSSTPRGIRNPYTDEEDLYLIEFLAKIAPLKHRDNTRAKFGRSGNFIYQNILVERLNKYPWASTHTWHSWRERYVKRAQDFDERIAMWQERYGINPNVQAKKIDRYFGNGAKSDVETPSSEYCGKRRRDYDEPSAEDNKRARKRPKRSDIRDSPQSGSDADEPAEVASPRSRPVSPCSDDVSEDQDEDVDQLADDPGPEGNERNEEAGRDIDHAPLTSFNSPDTNVRSGTFLSAPSSVARPTQSWPSLDVPAPSTAVTLYPPLPSPPLKLTISSPRFPGEFRESPNRGVEINQTRPVPPSVSRSHHPTPPPTSVQSDASVQSLSWESDPLRQSAAAKEMVLTVSSDTPTPRGEASRNIENTIDDPGDVSPSLLTSPSHGQRLKNQHAKSNSTPRKRLSYSPPSSISSISSISDGPFATSPPSPRRVEVIRGMPKPRPGKSFRDNDRVRDRNVWGNRRKVGETEIMDVKGEEIIDVMWPPVREREDAAPEPQELQPTNLGPTGGTTTMPNTATNTAVQQEELDAASDRRDLSGSHKLEDAFFKPVPNTPNDTPHPAAAPILSSTATPSGARIITKMTATPESDIFAGQMPIPSGSNSNPYVLKAVNLPESSTTSAFSPMQPSSPVPQHRIPRDQNRRRTFSGFGLRSALPDIDLLAELKGKRTRSRSPAFAWTKGSSDINMTSSPSVPAPLPLLTAPERTAARRGPPRKSVIPVVDQADAAVPVSLDQLSPSTSNLIVQVGLTTIFKHMEENHGFSANVVRRVWRHQNMDLNATDKKLLRMRIAAEKASYSDDDEKSSSKHSAVHTLPATGNSDHVEGSPVPLVDDYIPPPRSRAAHYLRLSEQGLIGEARQREIEQASVVSSNSNTPTTASSLPPKRKRRFQEPLLPPVWSDQDYKALQSSDQRVHWSLQKKFGEDFVRRKFLKMIRRGNT